MHELGIVQDVIEIVSAQRSAPATRVTAHRSRGRKANMRLAPGRDSGVLFRPRRPKAPSVEGAALEIVEIASGAGRCKRCGGEQALAMPFGRCPCGELELELVAGEELRIREMEVT